MKRRPTQSLGWFALAFYLGVILIVLLSAEQAFTPGTVVLRKHLALLMAVAMGVGLLSWCLLLPQILVGYLGMPRRIAY